jgi:hypothetical protein
MLNDFIELLKTLPKQKALELIRVTYLGMCETAKAEMMTPSLSLRIDVTERIDGKAYYNMLKNRLRGNDYETNSLFLPN